MSTQPGRALTPPTLVLQGRQADQKHCFSCGRILHVSAALCPDCGAAQLSSAVVPVGGQAVREPLPNQQSKFCYGCGGAVHVAAFDCPKCGAPQRLASPARPAKDRTAAILLAFFLGGIGAHKFYLGQPGLGILYLLFCWTLVPGLVALIEGLIYIGTHDADFQCKYS